MSAVASGVAESSSSGAVRAQPIASWGDELRLWRDEVVQWSQQELAEQVARVAFERREARGDKLDPRLIARWENGEVSRPQAVYRRLLRELGAPVPASAPSRTRAERAAEAAAARERLRRWPSRRGRCWPRAPRRGPPATRLLSRRTETRAPPALRARWRGGWPRRRSWTRVRNARSRRPGGWSTSCTVTPTPATTARATPARPTTPRGSRASRGDERAAEEEYGDAWAA
ncbi:hypothetical protein BJF78_34110 [Pseudonocardia sp. CNS-139]|nr:hypothetical protein BJF78_34110 [Pseudonocardia sp. CNS-139]